MDWTCWGKCTGRQGWGGGGLGDTIDVSGEVDPTATSAGCVTLGESGDHPEQLFTPLTYSWGVAETPGVGSGEGVHGLSSPATALP